MKFLVVDDSVTMRRILVNSLQRIGYSDCIEAGSGADALASFDATVGFVITDWNMPHMTGVEFSRALRARPEGRRIPILVVTTRTAKDDIAAAANAGASDYLVKPFTPQVLKEKIDAVLAATGVAA